jgi:uncharacterized protein (DUF934 family)
MPLIVDGEFVRDLWEPDDLDGSEGELFGNDGSWVRLRHLEEPAMCGLEVAADIEFATLLGLSSEQVLIAIRFVSQGDGRGLSLASSLRTYGYGGRLRAVGPLIADQYAYLLGVGFDEVEIPQAMASRQSPLHWRRAQAEHSVVYQQSRAGIESALGRRHPHIFGGHA